MTRIVKEKKYVKRNAEQTRFYISSISRIMIHASTSVPVVNNDNWQLVRRRQQTEYSSVLKVVTMCCTAVILMALAKSFTDSSVKSDVGVYVGAVSSNEAYPWMNRSSQNTSGRSVPC